MPSVAGAAVGRRPRRPVNDAAGIASLTDHLIDTRRTQPGMTVQSLANKLQVGIGDRVAQRAAPIEIVGADGVTDSVGVNAQCLGDGADFPMLGIKITANLGVGFWTYHFGCHPDRGIRGNGSTNRPLQPQWMQYRNGTAFFSGRSRTKTLLDPHWTTTRVDT